MRRSRAQAVRRLREIVAQQREMLARDRPTNLTPPDPWYRIQNAAPTASGGSRAEIYIYADIAWWGVTAEDFVRELTDLNVDAIDVRINSPGGDVWDGVAIYNALRTHRAEVTTYVDGLAASAASVIFMAGDRRVARRGTRVMIHEAAGMVMGNATVMREYADLLDAIGEDIARTYLARAGGTLESWWAAMQAETWYSATEAVAIGLATETDPERDGGDDTEPPDQSVVVPDDDDDDDPLMAWRDSVGIATVAPATDLQAQWDADAVRAILRRETVP